MFGYCGESGNQGEIQVRRFIAFAALSIGIFAAPLSASALEFEAAPGTPLIGEDRQSDPPASIDKDFVPTDVAAGHFNNDAYEDIAVVADVSKYIYVYLGSADGSLTPSASNPIGANSPETERRLVVHAADLDKDGDTDLATVGWDEPTVEVYLNDRIIGPVDNNNESFGTVPDSGFDIWPLDEASLAGYTSSYFGDKDGDGDDDLILGVDENRYVYLENEAGEFQNADGAVPAEGPSTSENGKIYSTTIGDFNGDGQGDLALISTPSYDPENPQPVRVLFAPSNGETTFAAATSFASLMDGSLSNVRPIDLNGDQYDDLIFQEDSGEDRTWIALGSANGPVLQDPEKSTLDFAFSGGPSFGDFNNDGKVDAALPRFDDENFQIALGDGKGNLTGDPGGPFNFPEIGPTTRFLPQRTASLDVNGDGQLDLAAVSGNSMDPGQGRGVAVMLGKVTGPKLGLTVKSAKRVKAGRKLLVTVRLRNTGDQKSGVIVLKATGPRKSTGKAKARKIKSVAYGKSVVHRFRVPVKRNAKGRFKVKVTVTHKGKSISRQTGKVRIQKKAKRSR